MIGLSTALLVVAAAVLMLVIIMRATSSVRQATTQSELMSSAFTPNPNNQISLAIRGWNQEELTKILADFLRLNDVPRFIGWKIDSTGSDTIVATFPNDIEPETLYGLVNYIRYPRDFDLTHRSIGVLCHVVLGPSFGIPDMALIGKRAVIYVPADDRDYDLVYVKVESGTDYKIPFTTLTWEAVDDARTPISAAGL